MTSITTGSMGIPFNVRQTIVQNVLNDLRMTPGTGETLLLVVGAHAAATHIQGFRNTQDIDFLVSFRGDITPIGTALSSTFPAKYRYRVKSNELFFLWQGTSEVAIDMIPFGAFEERMPVLDECRKLSRLPRDEEPVASIPALLVLKMSALCDEDRRRVKEQVDISDTLAFIKLIQNTHLSLYPMYSKWILKELKTNAKYYPPEVTEELRGLIPHNNDNRIEEEEEEVLRLRRFFLTSGRSLSAPCVMPLYE